MYSEPFSDHLPQIFQDEAVSYLKEAIGRGEHWFIAVLKAISLWTRPAEEFRGRQFHYLIGGEAFDWLLLAERLCEEIDGVIPEEELNRLLFLGEFPLELTQEEFKKLIGPAKYRAYLNYFYGITLEEALQLAVELAVRKERRCRGEPEEPGLEDEVFSRIYGQPRSCLLRKFREEKNYPQQPEMSLLELKEFTYWLFKYRFKHCEPAKVASDTRRALECLQDLWQTKRLRRSG